MPNKSKSLLTAEQNAEMATRGENVSASAKVEPGERTHRRSGHCPKPRRRSGGRLETVRTSRVSRYSPKWRGIVFKSEVTRILRSFVAGARKSASSTSNPALLAEKKIHCRLAPQASGRTVQACVCQETDHRSALLWQRLQTEACGTGTDRGTWSMSGGEKILFPLALRNILFYLDLVAEVESDSSINLFEAERRVVRPNRFR